jgi:hypothetical protein
VSDDDRARLEAIVRDRNHSHKHVQRARCKRRRKNPSRVAAG